MSRARNIKPSFFMNEALGDVPFEARLFFIGLWCLCDPEGKMEFRPKRVKAELFPYDDVDCTGLAQCLHSAGLIRVYTVSGETFIWVPTFTKHQTPHMKEKPRGYPDYSETYEAAPDKPSAGPVQAHLNPESGTLNPDIPLPDILNPSPQEEPVDKSPPQERSFDKSKKGNGSFNIVHHLDDTGWERARKAAEGWDIYKLAEVYNKSANGNMGVPDKPNLAFPAWCAKYTKGKSL